MRSMRREAIDDPSVILSAEMRDAIGDRPVEFRPSARAKKLSLSVSRIDGRVRITAPERYGLREVAAFLDGHADWLRGVIAKAPDPVVFAVGVEIPVQGRKLLIAPGPGRQVSVSPDGERLLVGGGEGASVGARVEAWLKELARSRLRAASTGYAAQLGVSFSRLTLRDTRSRWGSCSARGALSYSWRLILAPPDVLDYVAAHEVAHLREMNHSAAFWAVVERLRPDWREQRAWLRAHGVELHRYRA